MRQIVIVFILPFIISLTTVYFIASDREVNNFLFKKEPAANAVKPAFNFIENFRSNPACEEGFLKSGDSSEIIFLLGSSELTSSSEAIPYNFIPDHFTTQLKAIGHAGNQCFSMYAQLLANDQRLKNAPVIIILSPGWFESKASRGVSSDIFLEFVSERFLNRIIKSKNNAEYNAYLYKRIAELFSELNSPSLELKLINFKHYASKSFIHKTIYAPVLFCDDILVHLKEKLIPELMADNAIVKRLPIAPDHLSLNWDSLYAASKEEVIRKSTNNSLGIADDYYTLYIHGKTGRTEAVSEKFNVELEDFKMLIKLLKEKQANAKFIISPLNPLYYKNLKALSPTINIIESEIKKNGFSYLNLLETDSAKYEKPILHDIMHMSDYGWYKIDHFIIDTYHLTQ